MHSTLMSLLGHVVLTLLVDGFNFLASRVSRSREGAVQLEDGLCLDHEQVTENDESTGK